MLFNTIWLDARLTTLVPGRSGIGIVERGAVAAKDGRIAFAGPMAELPTGWDAIKRVALRGRWVTPGLIDCHSHLVYAGDLAHTVKATRMASEDDLVTVTLPRLDLFWPKALPPSKSSRAMASIAKPKRECSAPRVGSHGSVTLRSSRVF